jgi:Tfp pilus assembly protein PilF
VRPERALTLANEHASSYPRGTFAQERDMLRIEALTRLGERESAARYARAFRKQYPDSAHLQRLDALLQPQ